MNMSKDSQQGNQKGFVAIIVAAMIMVILSLITIGFTRIMQREQRQALDRQLSRQALYAAESGINDTYSAILAGTSGFDTKEKNECSVPASISNDGALDSEGQVKYTCILYDKNPAELVYEVSQTESEITSLRTESGVNFSEITVSWGNADGDNNSVTPLLSCGNANAKKLPSNRTNTIPVLRIDLTNVASLTRNNLINRSEYIYALPCEGSGTTSHSFSTGSRGDIVRTRCNGSGNRPCSLRITGLGSSTAYVSRVKSVYTTANVAITGVDTNGDAVQFADAQISIDVTARANDVVRRLRASIPFSSPDNTPEAVFQAFDGVCKLLSIDDSLATKSVSDTCSY